MSSLILLFSCQGSDTAITSVTDVEKLPEETLTECNLVDGRLEQSPEGDYVAQGNDLYFQREACTSTWHATAGASESTLRITLSDWDGQSDAMLSVVNLSGYHLVEESLIESGNHVDLLLPKTGEIFVHLSPLDPNEPANKYALEVTCIEHCERQYSRYPIVMLHGLGGADSFGDINYYYQVQEYMTPIGYALHFPTVSPFASTEVRGAELEIQLDELVEQGMGRRFNLFGHSQGGIDARYVTSVLERSEMVASIVTIGTPHNGTPIADLFFGAVDEGPVDAYWVDLGSAAFASFYGLEGNENSLVEAMGALTTQTLEDFNSIAPNIDHVYYASWAGISCGLLDAECQQSCGGEIIEPILAIPYHILEIYDMESDGLVPADSAVWGDYRGEVCADHADQIGLFPPEPNEAFDHLAFYLAEFQRISELGL